jgi:hypothetical protein
MNIVLNFKTDVLRIDLTAFRHSEFEMVGYQTDMTLKVLASGPAPDERA